MVNQGVDVARKERGLANIQLIQDDPHRPKIHLQSGWRLQVLDTGIWPVTCTARMFAHEDLFDSPGRSTTFDAQKEGLCNCISHPHPLTNGQFNTRSAADCDLLQA